MKNIFATTVRYYLWAWVFGILSCVGADDEQKLEHANYPPVAKENEEIYDKFLKGKLVYRPDLNSDEGKIELRIADLENPLEGTFDLSTCGDAAKYLSISTGYRKGKKPRKDGRVSTPAMPLSPEDDEYKVEIWIAPRFLIEKELDSTAQHFDKLMCLWKQDIPVGLFWNDAVYKRMIFYDYLIKWPMDKISKHNLYQSWEYAERRRRSTGCNNGYLRWRPPGSRERASHFVFEFLTETTGKSEGNG